MKTNIFYLSQVSNQLFSKFYNGSPESKHIDLIVPVIVLCIRV